jgi:hypothetical protein
VFAVGSFVDQKWAGDVDTAAVTLTTASGNATDQQLARHLRVWPAHRRYMGLAAWWGGKTANTVDVATDRVALNDELFP